jgi:hypothetical protein
MPALNLMINVFLPDLVGTYGANLKSLVALGCQTTYLTHFLIILFTTCWFVTGHDLSQVPSRNQRQSWVSFFDNLGFIIHSFGNKFMVLEATVTIRDENLKNESASTIST